MRRTLATADWIALAMTLALPSAVTWAYFIWLDEAAGGTVKAVFGVGKVIQFALPAAWVLLVQRQRPIIVRPPVWSMLVGAAFGLAVAAAMGALYVLVLKPAGLDASLAAQARDKLHTFGIYSLAAYLTLALFYAAIHSLLEEYYWRWFVFGQLARGGSMPIAITVASLGFAAHHVLILGHYFGWSSPLTWLLSAGVAIGGACWCWLYHKSGSLAGPWLSHALIDATIFAVGYDVIT